MFRPRSLTAGAAVLALLVTPGLTACGSSGSSPSSSPSNSSSGALPLDQRVVPGDLAGLTSPNGPKMASTPDDYAKLVNPDDANDPDLAEKRKQDAARATEDGLVAAAVKNYGTTDAGSGTSVAAQFGTPEQAKDYEKKLYEEQFDNDLPGDAQKGTVAGTVQSHTLIATAEDEGQQNTLGLASFVDGPFVYVLSAGGSDPTVTKDSAKSVLDQANQLFTRVKDRPAA